MTPTDASAGESDESAWWPATLEDARRRIDEIDTGLLDLLTQRAEVVRHVARLKAGVSESRPANALRLAREMRMLRRMAGEVREPLRFEAVLAIWREIVAASTASQQPLTLSVVQSPDADMNRLTRDAFGAPPQKLSRDTMQEALADIGRDPGVVAVIPAGEGWWRAIPPEGPKVFGALPLCGSKIDAYCLGSNALEPSGDDVTLIGDGATLHGLDGFHVGDNHTIHEAAKDLIGTPGPDLRLIGAYPRPLRDPS